ncbi:MAG: membrane protein insertase YidC, partial [Acidobacteriota bacterium]|nr:membrane protein insertase YidC [Acidobacteriota bacterium]
MSLPQQKDKLTPELRILGASLLSMVVILLWVKFFAPKPPVVPPQPKPAISAPQSPSEVSPAANAPSSTQNSATGAANSSAASKAAGTAAPISASDEHSVVVRNDLYRVEISNRGGVVKSWQLSKYMDDNKPQRVLDVVHPEAAQQTGGWPFSIVLDNS